MISCFCAHSVTVITEAERIERENAQRMREEQAKLAADRHQQQVDAINDLKRLIVSARSCMPQFMSDCLHY